MYIYAVGGNEDTARLAGIKVKRIKLLVYSLSGLVSALACVLFVIRASSGVPGVGTGWELDTIAAVVIGGTSLSGGVGTIMGTIIGAFIMSVLINGLRIMSVAQEWQMVLTGLIIILAVYTDNLRRDKK